MDTLSAEKQKQDWGFMKVFLFEVTPNLVILSETINWKAASLEAKQFADEDKITHRVKIVLEDRRRNASK